MATIGLVKSDSGTTRAVTVGDTIEVALEEIATSGYRWAVGEGDPGVLEAPEASFDPPEPGRLDAPGIHRFRFAIAAAGTGTIHLVLARAWDPASVVDTFEATIVAADEDG